ncbi:unnamed protein product [Blepharisma stoltei]|uniref:Uncharacterized protein n=1 Tax=Blepharisma stoltei TaxID=1481888 RepID=A0AAU9IPJ4_9CILI|nr:unnamed protein product [Blepharisma stoltei]
MTDHNYEASNLPSGPEIYCYSSAIYFNRNIYFFGGYVHGLCRTTSLKFDLDRNKWIGLTPLPEPDQSCHSIIVNRNILISGLRNRHLLHYSIDNNSFTVMPHKFAADKRKILINVGKLYLIECDDGHIYESYYIDEYGSDLSGELAWRVIGKSIINISPLQVYYTYNKGAIYIATDLDQRYYKFDLNLKKLTRL